MMINTPVLDNENYDDEQFLDRKGNHLCNLHNAHCEDNAIFFITQFEL